MISSEHLSVDAVALQSIFDHSLDGILLTAPDGRVLAANPAAAAILGMSTEEMRRRGRHGLADPTDPRWATGIQQRQQTGRFHGDLRMVRGDGSVVTVDVTSSVFRGADGSAQTSVIFRDVAERESLLEERERISAERRVLSERERMARDLHDTVIQQLFAVGMSLQAVEQLARPDAVATRVRAAVESLDEVMREIRRAIFQLQSGDGAEPGVRQMIARLVDDASDHLGFRPSLRFAGPIDTLVDEAAAHHVRAVLTEALSNVVRHAHASHVTVDVEADDDLVLTVVDDGAGLSEDGRTGHGLRNLAERAQDAGGCFTVQPRAPRGTILEWRMPLRGTEGEQP